MWPPANTGADTPLRTFLHVDMKGDNKIKPPQVGVGIAMAYRLP